VASPPGPLFVHRSLGNSLAQNVGIQEISFYAGRVEGMIPFNDQTLWKKVEECRSLDSSFHFSYNPGSFPPSQPFSTPDPSPTPDDMLQTPLPPTSAPPPLAPLPPLPLRITPFPVTVCEALDYMQSIDLVGSGILDTQAVAMHNVRVQGCRLAKYVRSH